MSTLEQERGPAEQRAGLMHFDQVRSGCHLYSVHSLVLGVLSSPLPESLYWSIEPSLDGLPLLLGSPITIFTGISLASLLGASPPGLWVFPFLGLLLIWVGKV